MHDLPPDWTDTPDAERRKLVLDLIAEGKPASAIARHFSRCTRNSVIGYCSRNKIKLAHKPGPQMVTRVPKQKAHGNKNQPKVQAIVATVNARQNLPKLMPFDVEDNLDGVDVTRLMGLVDLTNDTCRWPVMGQGASTRFCGASAPVGPYCAHHTAIGTLKP